MATKGMVMEERNLRKTRTGKVVSNKMDKTIVVAVENNVKQAEGSRREQHLQHR